MTRGVVLYHPFFACFFGKQFKRHTDTCMEFAPSQYQAVPKSLAGHVTVTSSLRTQLYTTYIYILYTKLHSSHASNKNWQRLWRSSWKCKGGRSLPSKMIIWTRCTHINMTRPKVGLPNKSNNMDIWDKPCKASALAAGQRLWRWPACPSTAAIGAEDGFMLASVRVDKAAVRLYLAWSPHRHSIQWRAWCCRSWYLLKLLIGLATVAFGGRSGTLPVHVMFEIFQCLIVQPASLHYLPSHFVVFLWWRNLFSHFSHGTMGTYTLNDELVSKSSLPGDTSSQGFTPKHLMKPGGFTLDNWGGPTCPK